MNINNCIWELDNLGEKVLEVNIEVSDSIILNDFKKLISDYQYIVVKVPMKMFEINTTLTSLGFTIIETQFNISKNYKSFNFDDRLVKQLYPHVRMEEIVLPKDLEMILSRISDNMFSTDRIYLDNHFSSSSSSRRYKNWIKSEFEKQSSVVSKIMYDDRCVGFGMDRLREDNNYDGLLGGIFEEYQSEGLALCTGGIRFIDCHKRQSPFKKMRTTISSNNMPVIEVYNYLGFKIDRLKYVFVKHNS